MEIVGFSAVEIHTYEDSVYGVECARYKHDDAHESIWPRELHIDQQRARCGNGHEATQSEAVQEVCLLDGEQEAGGLQLQVDFD